jgi:hypothetical protein
VALCEPRLLTQPTHARATLEILEVITATIPPAQDHRSESSQALRQGLGYGWSVAVVAVPDIDKPMMAAWLSHPDPDICWSTRVNLQRVRLVRFHMAWVERCTITVVSINVRE